MSQLFANVKPDSSIDKSKFEKISKQISNNWGSDPQYSHFNKISILNTRHKTSVVNKSYHDVIEDNGVIISISGRIQAVSDSAIGLEDTTSAPRLVLELYTRSGIDLLEKIRGDFAILILDTNESKLYCARDRTGIQPLYYHEMDSGILFASQTWPLLEYISHESITEYINKDMALQYLSSFTTDVFANKTDTFYNDISRLPPGHYLEYSVSGCTIHRYWQLDEKSEIQSTTQLTTKLERILSNSIYSEFSTEDNVGVMMSGGLDSTAVASIANEVSESANVEAISLVFDYTDESDEREKILSVNSECNIPIHGLFGDQMWALKSTKPYIRESIEGPCMDMNLYSSTKLFKYCNDIGRNIVLTGYGGNMIDGSRLSYFDLLSENRIRKLISDIVEDDLATHSIILWYLLLPILSNRIIPFITNNDPHSTSPKWVNENWFSSCTTKTQEKTNFNHISKQHTYDTYFNYHFDMVMNSTRREAYRHGVALRYPLLDSRLIEFIFKLPLRQQFRAGDDKYLFRKVVKNHLPKTIHSQVREDTAAFDPLAHRGFTNKEESKIMDICDDCLLEQIGIFVNGGFDMLYTQYKQEPRSMLVPLWRGISTELWLTQLSNQIKT